MPCRPCQRGQEHPAHVFLECMASTLPTSSSSARLVASPSCACTLCRCSCGLGPAALARRGGCPTGVQRLNTRNVCCPGGLEAAFAATDNREAHWLMHRLLWAMLWPASVVPANAAAARAIGAIFDQTWITWASNRTLTFGACWTKLLQARVDEREAPDGVASPWSSPSHSSSPGSANTSRAVDSSSPLTDPFLPSSQSSEAYR